jgi:putative FmdB family regulatory protein
MPTYAYLCDACGSKFEAICPLDQQGPTRCPECKSGRIRRDWTQLPVYHNRYSPLHPRKNRGRGH